MAFGSWIILECHFIHPFLCNYNLSNKTLGYFLQSSPGQNVKAWIQKRLYFLLHMAAHISAHSVFHFLSVFCAQWSNDVPTVDLFCFVRNSWGVGCALYKSEFKLWTRRPLSLSFLAHTTADDADAKRETFYSEIFTSLEARGGRGPEAPGWRRCLATCASVSGPR